jgi:hypothetical protein
VGECSGCCWRLERLFQSVYLVFCDKSFQKVTVHLWWNRWSAIVLERISEENWLVSRLSIHEMSAEHPFLICAWLLWILSCNSLFAHFFNLLVIYRLREFPHLKLITTDGIFLLRCLSKRPRLVHKSQKIRHTLGLPDP